MFWEWTVQQNLSRLEKRETRARSKLDRTHDELGELQVQFERMNLACAAMWVLLKQHGHSDEELVATMQELDLLDGKADGRLSRAPVICAACRRKTAARHATCLYCGAKLPGSGPFGAEG